MCVAGCVHNSERGAEDGGGSGQDTVRLCCARVLLPGRRESVFTDSHCQSFLLQI